MGGRRSAGSRDRQPTGGGRLRRAACLGESAFPLLPAPRRAFRLERLFPRQTGYLRDRVYYETAYAAREKSSILLWRVLRQNAVSSYLRFHIPENFMRKGGRSRHLTARIPSEGEKIASSYRNDAR